MVWFHLPGDPYFPNEGKWRRHNAEPKDDPADPIEGDLPEDSDIESRAYNPPQVTQNPIPWQKFYGLTP